ncbi:ribose-phosphate pyrophosphokinase [Shinella sp. 838]|nr:MULTISPECIES: ribose-phosphate pyrophosphokinase [unclassified Shinella]MDG4676130.1 ribose-phosphate pyrophosphokinase [Shinella sp. 838]
MILPMPGNEDFSVELARRANYELGALETRRFPDGESYSRIASDVRGRSVYIVCSLSQPDDQFLSLAFTADAVRELGAARVHLIAPYLCYMRQDTRFQPGEAVTSRTFARLLSSLFDSLTTVDAHLHRYKTLGEVYSIPAFNLHSAPVMAEWIGKNVTAPFLIGPDEESAQWIESIASVSGAPFAVLRKTRHGDRNVVIEVPDLSAWKDRQPILVDDIASSGRTLIEAARQIASQGLKKPVCAVVHGLLAAEAYAELSVLASRVVSTNSIPHPSNTISLIDTFLAAIETRADQQTK